MSTFILNVHSYARNKILYTLRWQFLKKFFVKSQSPAVSTI